MKNSIKNTRNIVLGGLFIALLTVSAYLKVYVAGVPHTFQLLCTVMAGMLLGGKLGALTVAVYVFMGLLGIPVFTGGGGFAYILQPTFGYLLGFIISAFVIGEIVHKTDRPGYKRLLCASFAGFVISYAAGMIYFYLIRNFYMADAPIGVWSLFVNCFFLIAPGDIILCVIAAVISKRLIPILRKNQKERV